MFHRRVLAIYLAKCSWLWTGTWVTGSFVVKLMIWFVIGTVMRTLLSGCLFMSVFSLYSVCRYHLVTFNAKF